MTQKQIEVTRKLLASTLDDRTPELAEAFGISERGLDEIRDSLDTLVSLDLKRVKEAIQFISDEILTPFTESTLYEDYAQDYDGRHGEGEFDEKYVEAHQALIKACLTASHVIAP